MVFDADFIYAMKAYVVHLSLGPFLVYGSLHIFNQKLILPQRKSPRTIYRERNMGSTPFGVEKWMGCFVYGAECFAFCAKMYMCVIARS